MRRIISFGSMAAAVGAGLPVPVAAVQTGPASSAPDAADWTKATPWSGAPKYSDLDRRSLYLTMPDGVRIAVDIWLPKGLAPRARVPTILEQTRYYRSVTVPSDPSGTCHTANFAGLWRFVQQGYAYVVVDVRGTGASFGSRNGEYGEAEVKDASTIVDWIVRQPWSNGKVGATGQSYGGTAAELLLRTGNPAVKAIAPAFSGYDFYSEISQPGGIQNTAFAEHWLTANAALDRGKPPATITSVCPVDADPDRKMLQVALAGHARNFDMAAVLDRLTFRDDRYLGVNVDQTSPYRWRRRIDADNVPFYAIVGWYDSAYALGALRRQMTTTSPNYRVLIGPWDHGAHSFYAPGTPVMTKSAMDITGERLRFFDHYLKGVDNGFESTPKIRYFTGGDNAWASAKRWPPAAAQTKSWFLAPGEQLVPRSGGPEGVVAYKSSGEESYAEMSRWHSTMGPYPVFYPDRTDDDRSLLTFTSEPLATDTEVTGNPTVTLYAAIDRPDADLFVYLEQVGPDGRVSYVTDGQLRVSRRRKRDLDYRNPGPQHADYRRDAQPVVPGERLRLDITMLPMSHVFRRGTRLRVAIAGADRSQFRDRPPQTVSWRFFTGPAASVIHLPVSPIGR